MKKSSASQTAKINTGCDKKKKSLRQKERKRERERNGQSIILVQTMMGREHNYMRNSFPKITNTV